MIRILLPFLPLMIHAANLAPYQELQKKYPYRFGELGSWKNGEIEIVLDDEKIQEIQQTVYNRHVRSGISHEKAAKWSEIGIINEDAYWIYIRDAVIFPSGAVGTYNRILWRHHFVSDDSVAILPLLPDGKIVLLLMYRHAIRDWMIETPRGAKLPNESTQVAAMRELREESGYEPDELIQLGAMQPESGTLQVETTLYLARVSKSKAIHQEESEAIAKAFTFTPKEIRKGIADGYLEVRLQGKVQKVRLQDPFLAYLILLAEEKGYIE